jgi:hypothetical protein
VATRRCASTWSTPASAFALTSLPLP